MPIIFLLVVTLLTALNTTPAHTAKSGDLSWTLEAPTGHASIGTVSLHLIDRFRWDPLASSRRRRQLMVQLWYPARPSPACGGAPYVEARVARILDRSLSVPLGTFEALRTHACLGAPAASERQPFPVVLYSHGYGSWRNASTALVEELVSRGFLVVTIDHTYDAQAVEFPNGTIAHIRPVSQPKLQSANPLAQWDASVEQLLIVRVADVRFVLDELAKLHEGRNPDAEKRPLPANLAGAFDLSRITMFGHSLGAATTIEAMRQDRRIRGGFMMDGPVPRPARDTRFDRPIMLVRSENPDIVQLVSPSWHAFAPGLRGWHRAVAIAGTNHNDFTDLGLVARHDHFPRSLRNSLLLGTIDAGTAVALVRSYLVAFLTAGPQRAASRKS